MFSPRGKLIDSFHNSETRSLGAADERASGGYRRNLESKTRGTRERDFTAIRGGKQVLDKAIRE